MFSTSADKESKIENPGSIGAVATEQGSIPNFVKILPGLRAELVGSGHSEAVDIVGSGTEVVIVNSATNHSPGLELKLLITDRTYSVICPGPVRLQVVSSTQTSEDPNRPWSINTHVVDEPSRDSLTKLLRSLRKSQHIEICATRDVEAARVKTGFEDLQLLPCAIPDFHWNQLNTAAEYLGHNFSAPFLITGMTGGIARGTEINLRLARAAAKHNIPMGVGSQRIALEDPDLTEIFAVKRQVPDVFLIANIGAAQLQTLGVSGCLRAIKMIDADALAIHVNVLQELVQVEGDRNFANFFQNIENVTRNFPVPVVVKEVGAGIDPITAMRLAEIGVSSIDTGGTGGTSWSRIEGLRAGSTQSQRLGEIFRDWGIPTAHTIKLLRQFVPQCSITATGGIRDGLMAAKAIALGATLAGIGLPLFRAALIAENGPSETLEQFINEFKTAMICSGARDIKSLRHKLISSESFNKTHEAYANGYSKAFNEKNATTARWNS